MLTYEVVQDECGESPREWDNLGTMVCWHKRMDLGDIQYDQFDDFESKKIAVNIKAYEHSGITITADPMVANSYPFIDQWDSGLVGFVYVTYAQVLEEWERKRMSHKLYKRIVDILIQEVKTYDEYLTGDVWGYQIMDGDDIVDSCWGFFGHDYCEKEAKSMMEYLQKDYEFENHLIGSVSP